jgi:hypothetical protein
MSTSRVLFSCAKFSALGVAFCASVAMSVGAQAPSTKSSPGIRQVESALARPTAIASPADGAIVIDGIDGERVWRTAQAMTDFRVYDPTVNGTPSMRTETRFAYDARHLYVFVRAFDPRPDSIVSLLSRRDVKTTSDQIKVMVDSYHDKRSGFEFAVNPAGVKRDYATYDDSREDVSWDAVWDVATKIDSLGWTAEFRIPLSQLRYAAAEEHTFGIMVTREIARTNEKISWPHLDRTRPGIASKFADVGGFAGLSSPRRIEATPYVITRNRGLENASSFERRQEQSLGGDLKYGVTSNLTLDVTINPDFGQVEADPAQLNLTAFETFLAERRPFFLEGSGTFSFGGDDSRLFHSRRIGRAPQLGGLAPSGSDIPGATNILGAAKLTGRLRSGATLGALAAVTNDVSVGDATVEPRTYYAAVRAAQDFRKGQSDVGLMFAGVDRNLDDVAGRFLRGSAITGGIDGRHRMMDGSLTLRGSIAASRVMGSAEAIARTQRNSVHYYNRPDAGLDYDTLRTSLGGISGRFAVDKSQGALSYGVNYRVTTPGFETNDIGFLTRADQQTTVAYVDLKSLKPARFWRNANASAVVGEDRTASGTPFFRFVELDLFAEFRNSATFSLAMWTDNVGAVYCDRCARGGPALRLSPMSNALLNLSTDPRGVIVPSLAAIYTFGDGGRTSLWRVRPYVRVRARSNLNWELGTRYQRNRDNTQHYGNFGTIGSDTTHYVFAHLDQHLLSFTTRLNYTATPTLSLQLYAEPFVTSGEFTNPRDLASPRAADYDARFRPVSRTLSGFNQKEFNTSAVLRWEYRPASTLFLVWTQGRFQDDRDEGTFDATRDYKNLFGARPDNTFLMKVAYWFGR